MFLKKPFSLAVVFFFLGAAFFAGYWFKSQDSGMSGPSEAVSQSLAAGKETETNAEEDDSQLPGTVEISPEKQQAMGVRLDAVRKVSETHTLRMLGRVAADENRIYRINTSVDGWIRKAYDDNTTGSIVRKDQVLAIFYSPEFLGAEQAYIYAVGSMDRFVRKREPQQQITQTERSIQQYKDSLLNLGMSETQIREIGRTRQYTENIEVRSPANGFVLVRNVSYGERIERGRELYRIADLGRVWILADLFENEAQYLKPGKAVKVSLPQQKKTYTAKVSAVLPQFDPSTRTLKVRLEADNPGYVLRPDMFVDVEIPITFPPAVVVPAGAVLDSGVRKTVFVDRGKGRFEPRLVETGWRFADRIEITRGLEPGERIVVSGNFLIDSESKMELAASGMYGTLGRDPVCGAEVAVKKAEKAGRMSVHHGKAYYFTSLECKKKFDNEPDRYGAEESAAANDQPCH